MRKNLIFLCTLFISVEAFTQSTPVNNFGIKFSGYVKSDFYFDSRQTYSIREGHFLLWPSPKDLDKNGDDVNAKPNFNFLAIQSRLTGNISGPDAFGAKTSGVLEADFFGNENSSFGDINGFRLRHAYGKLTWEKRELLFGQYWHPMFITACFPDVISFNTGAPFQPFSRNPQIRFTQKFNDFSLALTANSQRDFTSSIGSVGLRNSAIPELNAHLTYHKKDVDKKKEFLAGMGGGYKILVPRLKTDSNLIANESVGSYLAEVFSKMKTPKLTFKFEALYGQNSYDLFGISSFTVKSIDTFTNRKKYEALNSIALWTEIQSNGEKTQFALFAGYTRNLGASDNVLNTYSGTRSNIDYIYRISPRVIFISGKTRITSEIEYTTAAFGKFGPLGKVTDSEEVSNIRFLLAMYYFF